MTYEEGWGDRQVLSSRKLVIQGRTRLPLPLCRRLWQMPRRDRRGGKRMRWHRPAGLRHRGISTTTSSSLVPLSHSLLTTTTPLIRLAQIATPDPSKAVARTWLENHKGLCTRGADANSGGLWRAHDQVPQDVIQERSQHHRYLLTDEHP